jgi:hypothetical protein
MLPPHANFWQTTALSCTEGQIKASAAYACQCRWGLPSLSQRPASVPDGKTESRWMDTASQVRPPHLPRCSASALTSLFLLHAPALGHRLPTTAPMSQTRCTAPLLDIRPCRGCACHPPIAHARCPPLNSGALSTRSKLDRTTKRAPVQCPYQYQLPIQLATLSCTALNGLLYHPLPFILLLHTFLFSLDFAHPLLPAFPTLSSPVLPPSASCVPRSCDNGAPTSASCAACPLPVPPRPRP